MKRKSYAYTPWAGIRKLIPAPAQSKQTTKPASELVPVVTLIPEPAVPPPASDPTANRFLLECWLHQHRPDLLAAVRRAEEEAERAWFWAEAGFPDRLAAAETALAQAVAAGREAMQKALAGPEAEAAQQPEVEAAQDPEREMTFTEIKQAFGGFERVWDLSDAQAARLEAVFAAKGPVVVRSENGRWWSAEEWQN